VSHQNVTSSELLEALASRGLTLRLDGEKLALQGDARLLADTTLVQALRERKAELIALLREHQGNITAIARATGWNRVQIHRWLKRFDLDPRPFRGR